MASRKPFVWREVNVGSWPAGAKEARFAKMVLSTPTCGSLCPALQVLRASLRRKSRGESLAE